MQPHTLLHAASQHSSQHRTCLQHERPIVRPMARCSARRRIWRCPRISTRPPLREARCARSRLHERGPIHHSPVPATCPCTLFPIWDRTHALMHSRFGPPDGMHVKPRRAPGSTPAKPHQALRHGPTLHHKQPNIRNTTTTQKHHDTQHNTPNSPSTPSHRRH